MAVKKSNSESSTWHDHILRIDNEGRIAESLQSFVLDYFKIQETFFIDVSKRPYAHPEMCFEEHESATLLADACVEVAFETIRDLQPSRLTNE